jgi:hypothetical protein
MTNTLRSILLMFLFASCTNEHAHQLTVSSPIIGTWELVSATTIQADSIREDDRTGKKMIKIITDSHFAFFNHDTKSGKDSTALFVSGGGKYTFEETTYTEFLEYCNLREWEGHEFKFNVEIKGDTLIQSGVEKIEALGVDRKIIEKYLKVN